ncbi:HPr kinase/phosphorylase [Rhodoligotrophos defluvii]|uniref:HPr kinase/phosphorylase n=1 Tax=Rhodoligotrophos defluvii TaxID=2561934 RepID=UPI0010C98183|nr:HPr kinase/phosphatase C-terminal domain-containing protein [Rhodoligotrophos defluvii]
MAAGSATSLVHATCVAFEDDGVLILGPSGSGKSDLALRLIDESGSGGGLEPMPCMLVSDDQVVLHRAGDVLVATAPEALRGLIEVRGLGIMPVQQIRDRAVVRLAINFSPHGAVERMPDPALPEIEIAGALVPGLSLSPWEASAPAKVRMAIRSLRRNPSSAT